MRMLDSTDVGKPMRNNLTLLVILMATGSAQAALITDTEVTTDIELASNFDSRLEFVQQLLEGQMFLVSTARSDQAPIYVPLASGAPAPLPVFPFAVNEPHERTPGLSIRVGYVGLDMSKIKAISPVDPSPEPTPNPEPNSFTIWLIVAVTYVGAIRRRHLSK